MDESRKRPPEELRRLAAFGKASFLDPADRAQRRNLAEWCEGQARSSSAVWVVRRIAEPRRG